MEDTEEKWADELKAFKMGDRITSKYFYHFLYAISERYTVSHFSYAPLIKCKVLQKDICYFDSETTSVKCIYICISHRNFIVIR